MGKITYSADIIRSLKNFTTILPIPIQKKLQKERILRISHLSTEKNIRAPRILQHLSSALINTRSAVKHRQEIHDFITQHNIDCLFITESWLTPDCNTILAELVPENYRILTEHRTGQRGGGLAVIYKDHLTFIKPTLQNSLPFMETLTLQLQTTPEDTVHILLCYRPPGPKTQLLAHFDEFFSTYTMKTKNLLLLGDFNLWANAPEDPIATACIDQLEKLGLQQLINTPTHVSGHTLDLIFKQNMDINTLDNQPLPWTDHHAIKFNITTKTTCQKSIQSAITYWTRSQKKLYSEFFKTTLQNNMEMLNQNNSAEETLNSLNKALLQTADTVAPRRRARIRKNNAGWFNDALTLLKQERRRAEGAWRRNPTKENYTIYKALTRKYHKAIFKAKKDHFANTIAKALNRPRELFKLVAQTMNPTCLESSANETQEFCNDLSNFFIDKIDNIRKIIQQEKSNNPTRPNEKKNQINNPQPKKFTLVPITIDTTKNIIRSLRDSTSPNDIIPAKLLKECTDIVAPLITRFINQSFKEGIVPTSLKQGIINPLLKKPNLDPNDPNFRRPVTSLITISKIIEKVVTQQLQLHLDTHKILDPLQSGFRPGHGTETALLKIWDDALEAADDGESCLLVLLDLSAAFDTVDHKTLLTRLTEVAGVADEDLPWFTSFLENRSQTVKLGAFTSAPRINTCGVPQGSPLSPVLFNIYLRPLLKIISEQDLCYHSYADDTQLYFRINNKQDQYYGLEKCLTLINNWMTESSLKLNASKTELFIFHANRKKNATTTWIPPTILGQNITPSTKVKSLGVIFNSDMTMDAQVGSVVSGSHHLLRLLRRLIPFIPEKDRAVVVGSIINSRLDYANSLYLGLPKYQIARLQGIQNTAARLVTGKKPWESITPSLRSLHWLSVKDRVTFKTLCLTHKCAQGKAPQYLCEKIKHYITTRDLRSTNQNLLHIPKTRYKAKGERRFAVQGPRLWNALPVNIRMEENLQAFRKKLKTHLF